MALVRGEAVVKGGSPLGSGPRCQLGAAGALPAIPAPASQQGMSRDADSLQRNALQRSLLELLSDGWTRLAGHVPSGQIDNCHVAVGTAPHSVGAVLDGITQAGASLPVHTACRPYRMQGPQLQTHFESTTPDPSKEAPLGLTAPAGAPAGLQGRELCSGTTAARLAGKCVEMLRHALSASFHMVGTLPIRSSKH